MPEKTFDINTSRVRRAIDFSSDFTDGERLIAGVIADHFNAKEGYAFPTYGYLVSVYGFTPSMVWKTVTKIKKGWMAVDKSGGNNCYYPNMQKVESVLAELDAKRKSWKKRDEESRAAPESGAASRGEGDTSRKEGGTSRGEAEAPLVERPNGQVNVQPNAQSKDQVSRTRSDERVKRTGATSRKGRPSGEPAGNDDVGLFLAELHVILPDHVEFDGDDGRKPFDAEHSRRGELPLLRKLIRAGWTKDEVREMVETYVLAVRNDESESGSNFTLTYKTLSAIFAELFDKTNDQQGFEGDEEFYGRRLPERFLRRPEDRPSGANDNQRPDRASGDAQTHSDWPKGVAASIKLLTAYPYYPGRNKRDEMKLVELELKKLRGKVPFCDIQAGVSRYAQTPNGEDYTKNLKLSAFLAQRRWEDQREAA